MSSKLLPFRDLKKEKEEAEEAEEAVAAVTAVTAVTAAACAVFYHLLSSFGEVIKCTHSHIQAQEL